MNKNAEAMINQNKQEFFEIVAKSLIENYYVAIEIKKHEMEICNVGKKIYMSNDIIPISKTSNKNEIGQYIIEYLGNTIKSELMPQYLDQIIKDLQSTNISSLKLLYEKEDEKLTLIKNLENYFDDYRVAIKNMVKYKKSSYNEQSEKTKEVGQAYLAYNDQTKNVITKLAKLALEEQIKNLLNIENLVIDNYDGLLIIKNKERVEINIVKNISEFLNKESEIKKKYYQAANQFHYPNQIYYRGNKINFDLSTSLYRKEGEDNNLKLEHVINNRIIQNMPNDFEKCDSFFDKLTILKHFNCPSRLLDITKNPLIAVFFALDNYHEATPAKIGQIHCCFPKSFNVIKNSKNSDSVSLLSGLCTTDKNYFESFDFLIVQINDFEKFILKQNISEDELDLNWNIDKLILCKDLINCLKKEAKVLNVKLVRFYYPLNLNKEIEKILFFLDAIIKFSNKDYNCIKINYIYKICTDLKNEISNRKTFISELQHQALLINPYFNLFRPREKDIDTYYIVHPSLNNLRIRNQEGLFILVGAKPDINNMYYKNNETYKDLFETKYIPPSDSSNYYCDKPRRLVYIIDNRDGEFYENLSNVHGINKGFIYPELETKITQIREDIKREYQTIN